MITISLSKFSSICSAKDMLYAVEIVRNDPIYCYQYQVMNFWKVGLWNFQVIRLNKSPPYPQPNQAKHTGCNKVRTAEQWIFCSIRYLSKQGDTRRVLPSRPHATCWLATNILFVHLMITFPVAYNWILTALGMRLYNITLFLGWAYMIQIKFITALQS